MSQARPPPAATLRQEEEDSDDGIELLTDPDADPQHPRAPADLFTLPNGNSVRFFLHSSLTAEQRTLVQQKIITHGGTLTTVEKRANIILVSKNRLTTSLEVLRAGWDIHPNLALRDIRVEAIGFLMQCINNNQFKFYDDPKIKSRIAGRPGQRQPRIPFSNEDDMRLCRYIGDKVPDKTDGGRSGNAIFQELAKIGREHPSYKWINRHTWQSWRNRYVKNQEVLDPIIDQLVVERRREDRKGEYGLSRNVMRKRQTAYAEFEDSEGDEDEQDEGRQDEDGDEGDDPPLQRKRRHTDGGEAQGRQARKGDVTGGKKKRRTDGEVGMRDDIETEVPFEEDNSDLIPFEDEGEINMHYDDDYADQAGPSNTQRTPTPESSWNPLAPTLAPPSARAAQDKISNTTQGRDAPPSRSQASQEPSASARALLAAPPMASTSGTISNPLVVTKAARKKVGRASAPVPTTTRVTRARSKSLEPTAHPANTAQGKGKGRASALATVAEDHDNDNDTFEDDVGIPSVGASHAAISGYTNDEEDAVDELLNEDASAMVKGTEPEDDAQIRRALQEADEEEQEEEQERVFNPGGLDKFVDRHRRLRSSRAPSAAPSYQPLFDVQNAMALSRSSVAPQALNPLTTPAPHRRTRSSRGVIPVSETAFPSPGTRAKVVKEQKESESRRTPYEPPKGTRASAHKARRLG